MQLHRAGAGQAGQLSGLQEDDSASFACRAGVKPQAGPVAFIAHFELLYVLDLVSNHSMKLNRRPGRPL